MFSLRKRNEGKKMQNEKKVSVQMMKIQTAELVSLTEIEIYSQFSVFGSLPCLTLLYHTWRRWCLLLL